MIALLINNVSYALYRKILILVIAATPKFDTEPADLIVSDEEDAEFICKASGHPTPTQSWTSNDVPLSCKLHM